MNIAILSFNRPHFLREVLTSLRAQISTRDIVLLFQDGAVNPFSGRVKARQDDIDACIDLFTTAIPWGQVIRADHNLGIALNYERAETHVFADQGLAHGLFLEDDLVLSPNYLNVIRNLLTIAESDKRISYVSACGNMWASRHEQHLRRAELQHMHENWGFAMTRGSWLDERPFRKQYMAMVEDCDYSWRDSTEITRFYAGRGWTTPISSQDGARWIASIELGKVRLTSFACHARYIGDEGEHFTPKRYRDGGFDRTEMFDGTLAKLMPPSSAQIDAWLATECLRFKGEIGPFYPGHGQAADS